MHTIYRRGDLGSVFDLLDKELLFSILYIEIGLDHNNIRIELEKTGYCLLLRDSALGRMLHAKISGECLSIRVQFVVRLSELPRSSAQ